MTHLHNQCLLVVAAAGAAAVVLRGERHEVVWAAGCYSARGEQQALVGLGVDGGRRLDRQALPDFTQLHRVLSANVINASITKMFIKM